MNSFILLIYIMTRNFLLILLLLCFLTCTDATEHNKKPKENKLTLLDSISIPISQTTMPHPKFVNFSKAVNGLYIFNEANFEIQLYDIKKVHLLDEISLETEGPNGVGVKINGFYVHEKDSIWIYPNLKNYFFTIDSEGSIKHTHSYFDESTTPISASIKLGQNLKKIKMVTGTLTIWFTATLRL